MIIPGTSNVTRINDAYSNVSVGIKKEQIKLKTIEVTIGYTAVEML